jgi:hypothetical protein
MDRLPDLVRDSKLETCIFDGTIVHTYYETDSKSLRRAVPRNERWQRQNLIGAGSYGSVWLEKCIQGQRDIELRAVKQIAIAAHPRSKSMAYSRELEAIAKFSHQKVRPKLLVACAFSGNY